MKPLFLPPKAGWTLIRHKHRNQGESNLPLRLRVEIRQKNLKRPLPLLLWLSRSSLLSYHRTWHIQIQVPLRSKQRRNPRPRWKRTPSMMEVKSNTRPTMEIASMSNRPGLIQRAIAAANPVKRTQKPRRILKIRKNRPQQNKSKQQPASRAATGRLLFALILLLDVYTPH